MNFRNVVSSRFIGIFKLGDNINYNLRTLAALYEGYAGDDAATKEALRKPIVVTIASIAEAVLYDLLFRIQNHTCEGVDGIDSDVAAAIREKHYDRFATLIACARRHNLLRHEGDQEIYDELDKLRVLRNRIHITNENSVKPPDERDAFSEGGLKDAEATLELVMRRLETNYQRAADKHFVSNFQLPWKPHFPDLIPVNPPCNRIAGGPSSHNFRRIPITHPAPR